MADFPAPILPVIPTNFPLFIFKFIFLIVGTILSVFFQYPLKFSKIISPYNN